MELNREQQIISAFECCHSIRLSCIDCPFTDDGQECSDVDRNALSLLKSRGQKIKELTEDCENYKSIAERQQKCNMERGFEIKRLTEEIERLKTERYRLIEEHEAEVYAVKADTLRKMQERLAQYIGTYTDKSIVKVFAMFKLIDRIAKELLEGE